MNNQWENSERILFYITEKSECQYKAFRFFSLYAKVKHPEKTTVETNSGLPEFRLSALIAVRDRSGWTLSAGRPQPPKRSSLFVVFGHVLFPLESPPVSHPN